jgi:iron complex transport system substrate-binding protein
MTAACLRPCRAPIFSINGRLVALVFVFAASGCEGPAPPDEHRSGRRRIVSLAPALTQMVCALGAEGDLVGVGRHDVCSPIGLRVVGHFQNVNTEAVLDARPTHVLAMYTAGAVPDHLERLARVQGFRLIVYAYPNSIDDVVRMLVTDHGAAGNVGDGSPPSLSHLLDAAEEGRRQRANIAATFARIRRLTDGRPRPRVLLVIGVSPVMACGGGTVLDDMLEKIAARNAVGPSPASAPTFDREGLLRLRPDVILLLLPGQPPLRPNGNDPRLAAFVGLPIPAVTESRIVLINDALVLLPGTSVQQIALRMAAAVHRDLADVLQVSAGPREPGPGTERVE